MGEGEDAIAVKFLPNKRFGEWVIVTKLDEGGFGKVFKVVHHADKNRFAALKAEPNDVEGGSAIKLELEALRALLKQGEEKPHVPTVYHAAKHKKFCYMIMTLLGPNLKKLREASGRDYFTIGTWTRIGIQALYSIKYVHDHGYVHRDIKPNNFVFGDSADPPRARLLHILDFGLARDYAKFKSGKWIARRARRTSEFRGTPRYCSPNMHDKKEQGRQDDLISLIYVLIELHCGLPWQTTRNKDEIENMKLHLPAKTLFLNCPPEMHEVMPHLMALDCYQRPNYNEFYDALVAIMKRMNVKPEDMYDWEKKELYKELIAHRKGPSAWEDATDFFKEDPIKINSPPPKGSKSKKDERTKSLQSLAPSGTAA